MRAKKLYKPNVVYVVEIHGCLYYAGCHCSEKRKGFSEYDILAASGNYLHRIYRKNLITIQEYKDCCKLVHVEEYDSKEEALNREAELISRLKEHYGNRCLNKALGNKYGNMGVLHSEEAKRKMGNSRKGVFVNRPDLSKKVQQFTKDGQFVAEYSSISEASRQTGIPISTLSIRCSEHKKSRDESIWKFAP